ncbi:MAG: DUF4326 domain-containing protein [Paraclostridium sp.]
MIHIGLKWVQMEDAHNVYCGRGSPFGNPYPMLDKSLAERNRVCDLYETYFKSEANIPNSELRIALLDLLKKHVNNERINLQCFCSPNRCHCETIKRSLDEAKLRIIESQ